MTSKEEIQESRKGANKARKQLDLARKSISDNIKSMCQNFADIASELSKEMLPKNFNVKFTDCSSSGSHTVDDDWDFSMMATDYVDEGTEFRITKDGEIRSMIDQFCERLTEESTVKCFVYVLNY